jgi:hypothetical protein
MRTFVRIEFFGDPSASRCFGERCIECVALEPKVGVVVKAKIGGRDVEFGEEIGVEPAWIVGVDADAKAGVEHFREWVIGEQVALSPNSDRIHANEI